MPHALRTISQSHAKTQHSLFSRGLSHNRDPGRAPKDPLSPIWYPAACRTMSSRTRALPAAKTPEFIPVMKRQDKINTVPRIEHLMPLASWICGDVGISPIPHRLEASSLSPKSATVSSAPFWWLFNQWKSHNEINAGIGNINTERHLHARLHRIDEHHRNHVIDSPYN